MLEMANTAGLDELPVPRRCGRQTTRNNVESSTSEEYWRRAIFIPFMDHLITEFEERFSQLTQGAVLGLHLLPTKVNKLTPHDEAEIATYFKDDLPSPNTLAQEVRRWKTFWNGQQDLPAKITDILTSSKFSRKSYPNIITIICLLPLLQLHQLKELILP